MYAGLPGAAYKNTSALGPAWVVPCDAAVNVTFSFGGGALQVPVHPLDASAPLGWMFNATGKEAEECVGLFQPIDAAAEGIDAILGMAFRAPLFPAAPGSES
jgi:hypothetical protein